MGSTRPADEHWTPPPAFRSYERTVALGRGADWEMAVTQLLGRGVKTRSGFDVVPDGAAARGSNRAADR